MFMHKNKSSVLFYIKIYLQLFYTYRFAIDTNLSKLRIVVKDIYLQGK